MPVNPDKIFAVEAKFANRGEKKRYQFSYKLEKSQVKQRFETGLAYKAYSDSMTLNSLFHKLDKLTNKENFVDESGEKPEGAVFRYQGSVFQKKSEGEPLDLNFPNSVKGTPKPPYWSLKTLNDLLFNNSLSRTLIKNFADPINGLVNLIFIKERSEKNQADHMDANNQIFPDDQANIHYYNETFLTNPADGKGNFNFKGKRMVFVDTTNSSRCLIQKNIFDLFPENSMINVKMKGQKYSYDFKSPLEYSSRKAPLFFEGFLEIKEIALKNSKNPYFIISSPLTNPTIPNNYIDWQNKVLYIEDSLNNLAYVKNIAKVNDNLQKLNLAIDPTASQACDLMNKSLGSTPLICDIFSYFFVVNTPGQLTCIRLDNLLYFFTIMSTSLSIDPNIPTGASVFIVKNHGQWQDNRHMVWFSDGSTNFSYFVDIVENTISITPATSGQEYMSHFSVQIGDVVNFVKVDKVLVSSLVTQPLWSIRRSIFFWLDGVVISAQTRDYIEFIPTVTSFDTKQKKIISKTNSSFPIYLYGAVIDNQILDKHENIYSISRTFSFNGMNDRFMFTPISENEVLCACFFPGSYYFPISISFSDYKNFNFNINNQFCFSSAQPNITQGFRIDNNPIENRSGENYQRIVGPFEYDFGRFHLKKTNWLQSFSYVDTQQPNSNAIMHSILGGAPYSTQASHNIEYSIDGLPLSNNLSFGFFSQKLS